MQDETPLDRAHAVMEAAPDTDEARLRFYERLADAELFLMLAEEPGAQEDNVTPELFDLGDARYVLAFDREERLATFAGRITPYVALSGRSLAGLLAGQGVGLGLNLEVAPSSILLPGEAIDWLAATLATAPDELSSQITEVSAPRGLPENLIEAIDTKLATAMGLADAAYLAAVRYEGGAHGHMLAFVGAVPEAEDALTRAAQEALLFSGIEAGALDIAFFRSSEPVLAKVQKVALRFDLPQIAPAAPRTPPGRDPARPPKLR